MRPTCNRASSSRHLFNDPEALPPRKLLSNLNDVSRDTASVINLLEGLPGETTTHVRRLGGWEETDIAQVIDAVFPLLGSLGRRVDVFDVLALGFLDRVDDPPALHFD